MTGPDDLPLTSPDSERLDLLIRLLKLCSLINVPMNEGVCNPSGLSQTELKVVMALSGEGELAGHELMRILGAPAMSVSRAIAALRTNGLVEDSNDPDNRRRRPVRLSAAGEAFYAAAMPDIAAVADALLGSLTARQRRELARIADEVIAAMVNWGTHRTDD
ncbi:winged helix-turn-helix transcriptional regulator [Novosphingobium flavum]|uniref:Winged helix-turn-helix transcriptional regulator n=1 Tax=Novosphingobium aerophilum TaxID=2839843 RepID=A0A7X1F6B0_9SPHN|nr:MarR family winged helix-turn-helix transcriptional regulator [Novosphingobium aerophilum]MBC2651207.1 winged helix-turn-helix transcriptional regulator [Novosphingobium aerophilum]MBC2660764.1 winged helix-turn-helix transcriptional regulator [Novosphingobium aerophilum]